MRNRSGRAIILLGVASLALSALAQNAAAQQHVTVVVQNALPQPPRPVKAVRVSLGYQPEEPLNVPTGKALSMDMVRLR